jgi:AcrR family transcriptional regulator
LDTAALAPVSADNRPKEGKLEAKASQLLVVAREIIRETGEFDLPMRQLAARAQVSLRTPYEIFGSKAGIIRAILKSDQLVFHDQLRRLKSEDPLANLFDRIRLGFGMYRREQPFYRALFRATQGYSGGGETEPARENLRPFRILVRRVQAAGFLEPDLDPDVFGETMTDIFAANLRTWASSSFDVDLAYLKIAFGWASLLSAAATPPHRARMREQALDYQRQILAFEDGRGEAAS